MASLLTRMFPTLFSGDSPPQLAVRADTHAADDAAPGSGTALNYGAAIGNPFSGLGMGRDSGAVARPQHRLPLTDDELVLLMRGGLYRRVCELLPRWATWKGITVSDDVEGRKAPLSKVMARLSVMEKIRRGDTWARALGESLMWPITLGDEGKFSDPLQLDSVRGVSAIHVFDRREFSVATWDNDLFSPTFGQPLLYRIHPRRPGIGGSYTVHASRVWLMVGHEVPPSDIGHGGTSGTGIGDAVGQVMWDAIRDLSQTSAAGAKIAQELTIAVFKLKGFEQKMSASEDDVDGYNVFIELAQYFNLMKSVVRGILIGKDDDFQRIGANPAGFKDLSEAARLHLALVSESPAALLYGEAPAGLSTDEKSWWANWVSRCGQQAEEKYRPGLSWLLPILYMAEHGAVPEEWSFTFNPIGELTAKDLAELRKTHTEADKTAIEKGILSPREARTRYSTGTFQLELQPLEDLDEAAGEEDEALSADDLGEYGDELVQDASGVYHLPSRPTAEALAALTERADAAAVSIPKARRSERVAVPAFARTAAKKVLRWKQMHPREIAGMTPAGWRRARQLATKSHITVGDLIDIAAWFARHKKNVRLDPEDRGKPWRDPGYVAGLGWGSAKMGAHAARAVARIAAEEADKAIQVRKAARKDSPESAGDLLLPRADVAPDSAVLMVKVPHGAGFLEAQAAAEGILGPLETERDPHVTLLYFGAVPEQKLPALIEAVGEVLANTPTPDYLQPGARLGSCRLYPHRIGHFGDGDPGEHGVPVVIHYHSPLAGLRQLLKEELIEYIAVKPYKRFIAHATLGYLRRRLTGAEGIALAESFVPELRSWTAAELVLNRGGEEVARWSLAPGRLDAAGAAK